MATEVKAHCSQICVHTDNAHPAKHMLPHHEPHKMCIPVNNFAALQSCGLKRYKQRLERKHTDTHEVKACANQNMARRHCSIQVV